MEITARALWTFVHGMGFGALYLLACSDALVELYRFTTSFSPSQSTPGQQRFLMVYLLTMVILAWTAVLTGAYVIYPWYRAVPPPGTTNLAMFPQHLLMSSPTTIGWHSLGMEWKEHIQFRSRRLRSSLLGTVAILRTIGSSAPRSCFVVASFVSAGIAGFCGAMINKCAPVQGGHTIQLRQGGEK